MNKNPSKTVLVTGASGLLGSHLALLSAKTSSTVAHFSRNAVVLPGCESLQCDLSDVGQTERLLVSVRPQVIIHSAALTNVDACEDQKELAHALMVDATARMASWARKNGAQFVYISTDSVFDGQKGQYSEEDIPSPQNAYAQAKYDGEIAATKNLESALIVRNNFYGWNHGEALKFVEWILGSLIKQEPIYTFKDVYFTPLLVNDLAQTILDLIARDASGTFHVGSRDVCSKSEFALQLAGLFHLSTAKLSSISMDSFPFKAHRPKNTSLRVEKASRFLNRPMPSIQEGLDRFKYLLDTGWVASFKKNQPDWLKLIPAR